ncbi:sugar phosphate isomerase/epimerase family protein [Enterococcus casseliflavus]|uniref:sugar phosphate isomerase/epimerase family protein n=1 Tax=Enterococcus casseliflavus TaxID=37734 RepID=UPI0037ABAC4E
MKLGVVSAIFNQSNFEEMIDIVAANGLECVEVACWPQGKAQRRYAGVSHIDTKQLTDERIREIQHYCQIKGVEISALAYYPNPLDENLNKRQEAIDHLYTLIDASKRMGINLVTTFLGRMPTKNIRENLEEVVNVWQPILAYAEKQKVRIAIENCPMLFTEDEWPGGQNLMTTPTIWRQVFQLLDSEYLGLNYDPSHFVWQQIDYIQPLYEFKEKIFHVHYKDIKVYQEKLNDVGTMAVPLSYMSPKLPGLGDVDWGKYVSALTDIGFDGYSCIEIEDKAFENSYETVKKSVALSTHYLRNFV